MGLILSEEEVIETMIAYLAEQFPKDCTCCGRHFTSLADYLRNTTHVGTPVSYDADEGDWKPTNPMGTFSMANCACGSTLVIGSERMKVTTMWRLLLWARVETRKRGVETAELLAVLRETIDARVLDRSSPMS